MALQAHLWLEGTEQGVILGSCDLKGREGSILVQEFVHEIHMPSDPQSGLPTGNSVHKPLTICKMFDKASPKLYKALARGERLKKVELKWFRIRPDGKQEHYFSHRLEDAVVVAMKPYMRSCLDAQFEQLQHMESVSFTYRKISWTWQPEGIGAESDWREPAA